ncbi:hypothetical protein OG594_08840 [Streptomyces sp. NBC_01214]|uniref:hypothetical protein n=1 Tax=Streptomyces sp. NBC_01214 TaxID=2903777 RepID=UPI002255FC27|nr:hypothetical protein [Streptomyces sp. NBC_01214]MCX4801756.1 hypothetical protein [Streptomyces sp. NBC_01214]
MNRQPQLSQVRPVDSSPSMNEALRRARREQAIAHSLQAAALADEAGAPDYAAGYRADAARMQAVLRFEVQ